jgi:hypothetical protein
MKKIAVWLTLAFAGALCLGIFYWYFNRCNSSGRIVTSNQSPGQRPRIEISNGRC